jgi:hypothetical protein
LFSYLKRKHNDSKHAYHFCFFEFVVLGNQVTTERDIVCITFGSEWMLLNAFQAIVAGWGIQLNGDVPGKLCRKSIDLVEFDVNSVPKHWHNYVLCLGIIPKGTEGQKHHQITWDDFRAAAVLMRSYQHCCLDIKAICNGLVSLTHFISALCKFNRRQLGEEHRNRLRAACDTNAWRITANVSGQVTNCRSSCSI